MFRRVASPTAVFVGQTRSIYEYKFGQTPLTTPFSAGGSGRPPASPQPNAVTEKGKVEVTKLHNGARVISHNMGGPMVSVGAYVLAGPVYDPIGCPGVGAMMHLALTTSNFNNSLFQLDRNIRSVGAAESHFELYKQYLGIRIDARADKWRANTSNSSGRSKLATSATSEHQYDVNLIQDNIFTCLSAPRFHEADIERFRDTIDNQLKELRWQYPAQYAEQMLETVAFYREALGNPRFVPENNNSNITSKVLLDQYSRYVVPSRIVIAGVNVPHDELIAEYENTPFPHSATAPHHVKADAPATPVDLLNQQHQYVGGERQDHEDRAKEMGTKPDMESETICAVGWLAFGRDKVMLKDYAATLVFQSLLDMVLGDGVRYSKDETHVHQGVRSFFKPYQTAGLIGFTVTAEPHNAVKMVTENAKLVQSHKAPARADVEVAKHRALMNYLNQTTDNQRDYCDFLGTSLSTDAAQTSRTSIEEVVDAIRSVDAANVKKVADLMLSHPTSFYGHGEMLGFPSKRQLGL